MLLTALQPPEQGHFSYASHGLVNVRIQCCEQRKTDGHTHG